jgi:hypothetical protein
VDGIAIPIGPVRPSPQVHAELVEILNADESLLGEVYRREQRGETPADIQAWRGTANPNWVWHYERVVKTLLDGDLPTARTVI